MAQKMHVTLVEGADSFEKTEFCGLYFLQPSHAGNAKLAPKRFVEGAAGRYEDCTPEEQQRRMAAHCAEIPTDDVLCYCFSCAKGIALGGKRGVHLLELLFPAET